MLKNIFRQKVERLFSLADIKIGGTRPWDIHVYNKKFFAKVLLEGSLGLGESYMAGWWDSVKLDEFFYKVLRAQLHTMVKPWYNFFEHLKAKVYNMQNPGRAFIIGEHHYDMGNDFYQCMLDKYMIYSCGYWKNSFTLDEAQKAKLDMVCRKLQLRSGMRILDIGCGWGGTAKFAAEQYHVKVLGITVSKEQANFAKEFCRGLPVEIRLQDYRNLDGKFDRILSLGMFEHVGYKNHRTFMRIVERCLKKDGLFLLHTIGNNLSTIKNDPWIERYIFPNSIVPSARQICKASDGLFVLEDWHNFGANYDKTLMQWFENFHNHWDILKRHYDKQFYRMWKYYLLSCAGSSRARQTQLWQIVFSKKGVLGGYLASR